MSLETYQNLCRRHQVWGCPRVFLGHMYSTDVSAKTLLCLGYQEFCPMGQSAPQCALWSKSVFLPRAAIWWCHFVKTKFAWVKWWRNRWHSTSIVMTNWSRIAGRASSQLYSHEHRHMHALPCFLSSLSYNVFLLVIGRGFYYNKQWVCYLEGNMLDFIICGSEIVRDSLSGVPGYVITVGSLHFLTSWGCSWVKTAQEWWGRNMDPAASWRTALPLLQFIWTLELGSWTKERRIICWTALHFLTMLYLFC